MVNFLDLTVRELEILTLLAAGKTNKEIARALYMSVSEVDTRIKRIFKVIGVSNRASAVKLWQQALYGSELPSG